jgi:ribosomal protein S18 acetylase RimI-like enzyme
MMEKEASRNLVGLEIGALEASEIEEALGVISRGMRDNPIHIAAFGNDPERRKKSLHRFFGAAFDVMGLQEHMLVARSEDGAIVGVMGMMPPGDCLPGPGQQVRMLPTLLRNGPRAAGRTMRWLGAWGKRDPDERHWHFGPLAVDARLQGRGIGSKLLRVFCARMDAAGEDAYLETDKPINVRLYERFGFEVIGEQEVLGVPNYFMLRRAGRR